LPLWRSDYGTGDLEASSVRNATLIGGAGKKARKQRLADVFDRLARTAPMQQFLPPENLLQGDSRSAPGS